MLKKRISAALALTMMLCVAACGGSGKGDSNAEAPNLQKFYDDFMASLGADNAPAMMNANEDASYVESFFPGLGEVELKQSVLQMAMMSQVGFELALVECAKAEDVETVKNIFQTRVDNQVAGGAFYPAVAEAWENSEIIVKGNVVALIVAGEQQADAVAAFNKLFA